VANAVELAGRYASLDMIADHVENVGRQAAGNPHFVLFIGSFYCDSH
jgi:hypothetical protein